MITCLKPYDPFLVQRSPMAEIIAIMKDAANTPVAPSASPPSPDERHPPNQVFSRS